MRTALSPTEIVHQQLEYGVTQIELVRDATALSRVFINPMTLTIGVARVRVAGIGGVWTDERYRMQGYARQLMEDSVAHMLEAAAAGGGGHWGDAPAGGGAGGARAAGPGGPVVNMALAVVTWFSPSDRRALHLPTAVACPAWSQGVRVSHGIGPLPQQCTGRTTTCHRRARRVRGRGKPPTIRAMMPTRVCRSHM